jgi:hypothetical protein
MSLETSVPLYGCISMLGPPALAKVALSQCAAVTSSYRDIAQKLSSS